MSIIEGELGITLSEASDQLRVQRAAEAMANRIVGNRQLILNKTGLIDESIIISVLDTMEAQSFANVYTKSDGRPVRFSVWHVTASELREMKQEMSRTFPDRLAKFVVREPDYIARARSQYPRLYETEDADGKPIRIDPKKSDEKFLRQVVHADYSLSSPSRFSIRVRETVKRFGNPTSYPLPSANDRYEEQDPHYPMLIPVFDIRFTDLPADPVEFLKDYNKRYEPHEEEIYHGKVKRSDIFSESEMAFADECQAVVGLIDGSFYQSFDLPRTYIGIVAPLFPYQVIEQNYGYAYESWLRFGPNDELMMQMGEVHQEII